LIGILNRECVIRSLDNNIATILVKVVAKKSLLLLHEINIW